MLARLISIASESSTVQTFYFEPRKPLDYIAGQFVELTLPHADTDNRGDRRWFTLSSSPSEKLLAITVNFAAARSSFKRHLRLMKPGDTCGLNEVLGDFVLPMVDSVPLIWIAGGIGITPFRSIAKYMADSGDRRDISMFYSLGDHGPALFDDVFKAACIDQRHMIATPTQGRLSVDMILSTLSSSSQADGLFYISGPETLVDSMTSDLRRHGVDGQRIVTDSFLGYN